MRPRRQQHKYDILGLTHLIDKTCDQRQVIHDRGQEVWDSLLQNRERDAGEIIALE